jgi:hypothetical protein
MADKDRDRSLFTTRKNKNGGHAQWPIKFTNDAKPGKALKCKPEESMANDYEEKETDRF